MARLVKSEAKFVVKTNFKGRDYEVGIVETDGDYMAGWIDGGSKRIGFAWRPSKPEYKTTPAVYEANYKDPKVVAFVYGILDQASKDSISDNHPGGGGRSMDNLSMLIKKGHVRKACWCAKDGNPHAILRGPCVVNPANMTEAERKEADAYVAFYKTLVSAQGKPLTHEEVMDQYKNS